MPRLVLSISTLHRPEGLERILRSLASQNRPEIDGEPVDLSVVVVNNDPDDASPDSVAGRVAASASSLYARNLFSFIETMVDKASKALAVNWDDELVKATALTKDGAVIHPNFQPK